MHRAIVHRNESEPVCEGHAMALPRSSAYIVSQTLRPKGICRGRALGRPSRYCSPMTQNLLVHEASPYLLQHKDNPVHWRSWGPEALAEAKR